MSDEIDDMINDAAEAIKTARKRKRFVMWKAETERVIDAYKGEVENLRIDVKALKIRLLEMKDEVSKLKAISDKCSKFLDGAP